MLQTLTEAAEVSERGVRAVLSDSRLYSLILSLQYGNGPPVPDALNTLRAWLGCHPSEAQMAVAAIVVAELGGTDDIDWQKLLYKLQRQRWGR